MLVRELRRGRRRRREGSGAHGIVRPDERETRRPDLHELWKRLGVEASGGCVVFHAMPRSLRFARRLRVPEGCGARTLENTKRSVCFHTLPCPAAGKSNTHACSVHTRVNTSFPGANHAFTRAGAVSSGASLAAETERVARRRGPAESRLQPGLATRICWPTKCFRISAQVEGFRRTLRA